MLMTKYFVLLHIPRTGGHFVRKVCLEHFPRTCFIPNDLDPGTPYDEIATDFSDLPMFSLVRNPWDWYVSWYHYLTQTNGERRAGPMWETAFDSGRNDFRQTVINACTGQSFDSPRTGSIMRELRVDHYTALYTRILGSGVETGPVEVGMLENLRQDLLDFLGRHDVPIERDFVDAVDQMPPQRTSEHSPYRTYYDDELRDLVGEKARLLVERYGYAF
jgi:hypothetical protein